MTNIRPTLRDARGNLVREQEWASKFGSVSGHAHIWQVEPGTYHYSDFPTLHGRKRGELIIDSPSCVIATTSPNAPGFAVEPDLRAKARAEKTRHAAAAAARRRSIVSRAVLVGSTS